MIFMRYDSHRSSLIAIFLAFLRTGCFTFSGGLAMLPLIHREAVEKNRWLNEDELVDIISVSQSLPGVIALNVSVFIGYRVRGKAGAAAAVLGMTIPAVISIILIITTLFSLRGNVVVEKIFSGIVAGSCALILSAAYKVGKTAVIDIPSAVIAIVSFAGIICFGVHAAWAIVMGAAVGTVIYLVSRYTPPNIRNFKR
jgi:chromate transporter